tara:strand:- start:4224 stop:4628 length:405 start_codon:yes stop_codon:yes gene_type:complete
MVKRFIQYTLAATVGALLGSLLMLTNAIAGEVSRDTSVGKVMFSAVCTLDGAQRAAIELQVDINSEIATGCNMLPGGSALAPASALISGPHTDSDGDPFYVLEIVAGDGKMYVLGWPGHNFEPKLGVVKSGLFL